MTRTVPTTRRIAPWLALAGSLVACDSAKPVSPPLTQDGADQVVPEFAFDETRETALDESALGDDATRPGHAIVTLYFEGGLSRNCARWDFKLRGDGVQVAEGVKLDETHQGLLKSEAAGEVVGNFDTRGGQAGLRVIALAGRKLRLDGIQEFCLTKDATEFDVRIDVKTTRKLTKLFSGVEAAGQAAVRVRVTDAKDDPAADGATDLEAAPEADALAE